MITNERSESKSKDLLLLKFNIVIERESIFTDIQRIITETTTHAREEAKYNITQKEAAQLEKALIKLFYGQYMVDNKAKVSIQVSIHPSNRINKIILDTHNIHSRIVDSIENRTLLSPTERHELEDFFKIHAAPGEKLYD